MVKIWLWKWTPKQLRLLKLAFDWNFTNGFLHYSSSVEEEMGWRVNGFWFNLLFSSLISFNHLRLGVMFALEQEQLLISYIKESLTSTWLWSAADSALSAVMGEMAAIFLRAFCQQKGCKRFHSGEHIHIHYSHPSAEHDRLIETPWMWRPELRLH